MIKKILVLLIVILILGFLFKGSIFTESEPQILIIPKGASLPTPTSTPAPIKFDSQTNLEKELEKLTPRKFTDDFDQIKEEIESS